MAQENRIYVGHGKRVKDYDLVNFSVCLTDVPTTAVFEYKGKNYIKLVIGAKRETDKYGKTHSIWVDTFKPEKREKSAPEQEDERQAEVNNDRPQESGIDEIPF